MIRKILIDVNVFEDVLSGRKGANFSTEILQQVRKKEVEGWVSANTYGILFYLQRKNHSEDNTRKNITAIFKNFIIIPTRKNILSQALKSNLPDFEDNIQIESANQFHLDAIITRNIKDFKDSKIPAYTPEEFLNILSQNLKVSSSQSLKIPFLDLKAQFNNVYNEIDDEITNIISNTAFIMGKPVVEFEKNFAHKLNAEYCIGVGNGTDALMIALKSLGIGNGDEVITAANSFIATSEAISAVGAKVVFVDVNSQTYNLNVDKIEEKITVKTKAIIPVHLYGQPAEMKDVLNIARKHNLRVIEDSAQAHFAEYQLNDSWQYTGTFGDIAAFSFYPGKNLGAYGDGGAVVTNDEQIAKRARMYANHGRISKYNHEFEGYNSRLDGIQAAVLNVKLKYIIEWTEKRRAVAALYSELLSDVGDIVLPFVNENTKPVWHLYVIRTKYRDRLKKFLAEKEIASGIHYPIALPNLIAYEYLGHKKDDFPIASQYQDEILSLPIYPELTDHEVKYIASNIKEFYEYKV